MLHSDEINMLRTTQNVSNFAFYNWGCVFCFQNNDKLSLVVGRRHVSAKRQQNGHQDEVDVAGNTPIKKTAFPAISHSRSRSEPAIQHSDLEITASEVDSDDSSEDEGLYEIVFYFPVLLQNKGQKIQLD